MADFMNSWMAPPIVLGSPVCVVALGIWLTYYCIHIFGYKDLASQNNFRRMRDGRTMCTYCTNHRSDCGDGRCSIKELVEQTNQHLSFMRNLSTDRNKGSCFDFEPKWWVKRRIGNVVEMNKDDIIMQLQKEKEELEQQFLKASEEARE